MQMSQMFEQSFAKDAAGIAEAGGSQSTRWHPLKSRGTVKRTRAERAGITASSAILPVPLIPRRVSLLSHSSNPACGRTALGFAARDVTGVVTHLIGAKRKEPLHRLGNVLRMDDSTREWTALAVLDPISSCGMPRRGGMRGRSAEAVTWHSMGSGRQGRFRFRRRAAAKCARR